MMHNTIVIAIAIAGGVYTGLKLFAGGDRVLIRTIAPPFVATARAVGEIVRFFDGLYLPFAVLKLLFIAFVIVHIRRPDAAEFLAVAALLAFCLAIFCRFLLFCWRFIVGVARNFSDEPPLEGELLPQEEPLDLRKARPGYGWWKQDVPDLPPPALPPTWFW